MTLPVIDKQQTFAALDDSCGRFVDQLRSGIDPSKRALGVWNVAELATHVSLVFQAYPGIARGEGSSAKDHRRMPEEWQRRVREDPERDLHVLSDRIQNAAKDFKEVADGTDWTSAVPYHGGVPCPVYALGGLLINECEIHGRDIAKTTGANWKIDPEHARLAIDAHYPLMPHFFDQAKASEVQGVLELKVRGRAPVYLRVADAALTVSAERPERSVSAHISADPVTYMLLGYGRISRVLAALTGKVVVWGTNPLLALRLPGLFYRV